MQGESRWLRQADCKSVSFGRVDRNRTPAPCSYSSTVEHSVDNRTIPVQLGIGVPFSSVSTTLDPATGRGLPVRTLLRTRCGRTFGPGAYRQASAASGFLTRPQGERYLPGPPIAASTEVAVAPRIGPESTGGAAPFLPMILPGGGLVLSRRCRRVQFPSWAPCPRRRPAAGFLNRHAVGKHHPRTPFICV